MLQNESPESLFEQQSQAAVELAQWEALLSLGKVIGVLVFLIALYMFLARENRGWMSSD